MSSEPKLPQKKEQPANTLGSRTRERAEVLAASTASNSALAPKDTTNGSASMGFPAAENNAGLNGTTSNHDQKNDDTSSATGEMLPVNLSSISPMGASIANDAGNARERSARFSCSERVQGSKKPAEAGLQFRWCGREDLTF